MPVPQYVKPVPTHIPQTPETEKLYSLEDQRNALIEACATEWASIMGVPLAEFWTRAVPAQLFNILESYDRRASKVAAEAYLEFHRQRFGD